jgi:hypothetical protein
VKRSTLLAGVAVVLIMLLAPTVAQSASRGSEFAKVCHGNTASKACDRFLAPVACSPANPFKSAPFSCQYLLGIHPCHANPASTLCQLFLSNYCFERPDSVACFYFRAEPAKCSVIAESGIAASSATCALFKPDTRCNLVEADGSPPATPECKLYAAAFLDYCQQRAQAGACNNPYGGAEETLDFVTETRPCPGKKRRRHRVCRVRKAATPAPGVERTSSASAEPVVASPWPFSTITYYVGQTNADGSTGPAPRRWATQMIAAFRAWSAAHAGWTFQRAASPKVGDADVVALAATRRKVASCVGVSGRGFGYTQAVVAVGGACLKRDVLALATAHEIGHLLGLEHETSACSVMNAHFITVERKPRPSRCGARSGYEDRLVQASDVRSARALTSRPVGGGAPCDPKAELPVFAQDFVCKYTVNCAEAEGRNVFAERGTVVIDAELAARCHRVLRVAPVEGAQSEPPRQGIRVSGTFAGTSSQGKAIRLALRDGIVRGLSMGVHFTCTDNTSQFGNSIRFPTPSTDELGLLGRFGLKVVDPRVNGDETIGPFPPLATTAHGFRASLAPPNASALYDLVGSFSGGSWTGSVRIVEGWHASPLGLLPDPDGEVVCDTAPIDFTARPSP